MLNLTRLRRRLDDDGGITVTELLVVTALLGTAMAIVMSLSVGFLRNVHFQNALADVEANSRPVVRDMIIQIRQSVPPNGAVSATPVSSVGWDHLEFLSDRIPFDGIPERHRYYLDACSLGAAGGGECSLMLEVTEADDTSTINPPNFTYGTKAPTVRFLLGSVLAEPATPLFSIAAWVGDPAVETILPACRTGTATPCDLPLVHIDLAVDPSDVLDNPRVFELHEEVRLRNAA